MLVDGDDPPFSVEHDVERDLFDAEGTYEVGRPTVAIVNLLARNVLLTNPRDGGVVATLEEEQARGLDREARAGTGSVRELESRGVDVLERQVTRR